MKRVAVAVAMLALLGVAGCQTRLPVPPATDASPGALPPWAKVRTEQIAEAKKHGVPVAFENDLGMRFVLIPAGTFVMGSPKEEEGRDDDETQHEVTITKPYYMQTTEVTNAQYRHYEPKQKGANTLPVSYTSWMGATAFAAWLTRHDDGRSYRFPTEAEWEYACRAGTTTPFSFGKRITTEQANFYGPRAGDDATDLTPVASYPPNGWGLFDMHGNIAEWCRDWYGEYPRGRCVDPQGPSEADAEVVQHAPAPYDSRKPLPPPSRRGKERVHRGGHSGARMTWVRSALRGSAERDKHFVAIGFRLVSPLPELKGGK